MGARRLALSCAVLVCATGGLLGIASPAMSYKQYFEVSSFGEPCSTEPCGNGQFAGPAGVAVNDQSLGEPEGGDVYVIDGQDQRVERFSSTGAYLGQFDGSATPAGSFAFGEFFGPTSRQAIAVDNSGEPLVDPSVGDVYVADSAHEVVDKFSATGTYLGQLTGTCSAPGTCPGSVVPFGDEGIEGIATDSAGNLWVLYYETFKGEVAEFTDSGEFVRRFSTHGQIEHPFAVDAGDHVYAADNLFNQTGFVEYVNGEKSASYKTQASLRALAANEVSGELLADVESTIEQFAPIEEAEPTPIAAFGSLEHSESLAVNSSTGAVYASEAVDKIKVFNYLGFPSPRTGSVIELSETDARLRGTVNPESERVTECYFEYGLEESYGSTAPCEPAPGNGAGEIGEGAQPVPVVAPIPDLQPGRTYHFRLVAANAHGASYGRDETFFTFTHPAVELESVATPGSTETTVRATIDTGGVPTTYHVEYGAGTGYGSSTPDVSIGSGVTGEPVLVRIGGLTPATEYHFRFVAKNELGDGVGVDSTFSTVGSSAVEGAVLPDDRAYELVSPPIENQDVSNFGGSDHATFSAGEDESSSEPFQASIDGDSVVFAGQPSLQTGSGAFGDGTSNEWVAHRSAGGWSADDVSPPGATSAIYALFSEDLSTGVFDVEGTQPIEATPPAPAKCGDLFVRGGGGGYRALVTQAAGENGCGDPATPYVTPDGSHVLFEDEVGLTPGAHTGPQNESPYQLDGGYNLYDSVDGVLHQVNILPDGEPEPTPDAWLGVGPHGELSPNFSNAASRDGSRVFWSSEEPESNGYVPKALYVRINDTQPQSPIGPNGECEVASDACTRQVDLAEPACVAESRCESGGGTFLGASADGSSVFFSDCRRLTAEASSALVNGPCSRNDQDLYEYDVASGHVVDLTPDHTPTDELGADVSGFLGASEDGSYLYFVAGGVLAPGAKSLAPACCNVYVRHDGATTFITAMEGRSFGALWGQVSDSSLAANNRTSEVSPSGRDMVFESPTPLTGYDNESIQSNGEVATQEIFIYDAPTAHLSCVSCMPTGLPVTSAGNTFSLLPVPGGGGQFPSEYRKRSMSASGNRVFFDTDVALVPKDTNGQVDVYEWERPSAEAHDSCTASAASAVNGGCLYILSGGQAPGNSYFDATDLEGDNVFFTSRARLTRQALDENDALYDARVEGGFPELSTSCTGTGCQGVPPAPPIFATPSSVTFDGVGNFPAAETRAVVPKAKAKRKKAAKCKRGFVRRGGRCVRRASSRKRSRPSSSSKSSRGGKR